MRRRVRWNNVGRAAGAALIVGLVAAWPRLAPPEPTLPGPQAAPLVGDDGPMAPDPPAVEPAAGQRDRARERNESRRGRRPAKPKRRRGGEPAPTAADRVAAMDDPAAPRQAPPAPMPNESAPQASPAPDPAQTEFGFENR